MNSVSYVNTQVVENYVAGNGQALTDLIKQWANVYFPSAGIGIDEYHIDGVSYRIDGGIDGLIDAPDCVDALGILAPKSVLQFKAGASSRSEIKAELTKEPAEGKKRIIDFIKEGYKLVWFVGKGLNEIDWKAMSDNLAEIVAEIQHDAPKPVVVEIGKLCQLLSYAPVVASQFSPSSGIVGTSSMALKQTPHDVFETFVPGSHFEALRDDIADFFAGKQGIKIKYIAGEPGIGKSRSVLEAVEANPHTAGLVYYFEDQTNVKAFLDSAKHNDHRGFAIIDEYIGDSSSTTAVTENNIPKGFRIILIGNSHRIDQNQVSVTNRYEPLTDVELVSALATQFPELPDFRIRDAISLSRSNLRLARSICDYLDRNPGDNLGFNSLEKIVDVEIARMEHAGSGRTTLAYLSLVRTLIKDRFEEFCGLVGLDVAQFKKDCREMKNRSGFIQDNPHVAYVGAAAIAQVALVRLWRDEQERLSQILQNPGSFADEILATIKQLSPCHEREEMLAFFKLPVATLSLPDLKDQRVAQRLLHLLVADPKTYLPAVHRVIKENRGNLANFRYESVGIGRRDLIWRLRDLAQFAEHFEKSEEIVFWLAVEEVSSAYRNDASNYWPTWFRAYFDFTTYPYDKRLDLLEERMRTEDQRVLRLISHAICHPFPHHSIEVPSQRVAGMLAPPELHFIYYEHLRLAAERIPKLIGKLLKKADSELRHEIAKKVVDGCYQWLDVAGVSSYARVVLGKDFPEDDLRALIVRVRHFVSLKETRDDEPTDEVTRMFERHEELLGLIDQDNELIDILEIGQHGHWEEAEAGTWSKQQTILAKCQSDPTFTTKVIQLLANPEYSGAMSFGVALGRSLNFDQVLLIFRLAWQMGFSSFSFAALKSYLESNDEHYEQLLGDIRETEASNYRVALSMYQAFDDTVYFKEVVRLLNETEIPTELFGRFWLRSGDDLDEKHYQFIRAINRRIGSGDQAAFKVGLNIAAELARNNVEALEAKDFCLKVFLGCKVDRYSSSTHQWTEIGLWLLSSHHAEVIRAAGMQPQSEFSEATHLLSKAALTYPTDVLEALKPRLQNPGKEPYLLGGGLVDVMAQIPPDLFMKWIKRQPLSVKENVAGHLPKPYLDGETAMIPEVTRKFWEWCSPESKPFKRAMDRFAAHTFSTGVFTGHGIELFTKRIEIAKQMLSDPVASIRLWAEDFLGSSQHQLERAQQAAALDVAMRSISD